MTFLIHSCHSHLLSFIFCCQIYVSDINPSNIKVHVIDPPHVLFIHQHKLTMSYSLA